MKIIKKGKFIFGVLVIFLFYNCKKNNNILQKGFSFNKNNYEFYEIKTNKLIHYNFLDSTINEINYSLDKERLNRGSYLSAY